MKPILFFILSISFSSYSQVQSLGRETSQFASWDLTREVKSTIKIKEVSGSAYSDENFYDGQIRLTDSVVTVLPVRYNVVLDELGKVSSAPRFQPLYPPALSNSKDSTPFDPINT